MNTTQNRSKILAQFLRAALAKSRGVSICRCRRCRTENARALDEALVAIEAVAEELEAVAVLAAPERPLPAFVESDLSLLSDIADGYSTVTHYDRLDELRERLAIIVRSSA